MRSILKDLKSRHDMQNSAYPYHQDVRREFYCIPSIAPVERRPKAPCIRCGRNVTLLRGREVQHYAGVDGALTFGVRKICT